MKANRAHILFGVKSGRQAGNRLTRQVLMPVQGRALAGDPRERVVERDARTEIRSLPSAPGQRQQERQRLDQVRGQQIEDSEPHDLEITVRLSARTVQIVATLDDRPLYEWSGPATSLNLGKMWSSLPQPTLHLGAGTADWVVSAVKVKRLEK